MQLDIEIGVICWIRANPHPLTSPALQAGLMTPDWIPKTIVGLVATANRPPPPLVNDVEAVAHDINHRALVHGRFHVQVDDRTKKVLRAFCSKAIISAGWTPPFNPVRLGSNAT
jgi:hypothetical protein